MKVINSIIAGLLITSLAASACTRCDETAVSPSNYGELCTVSVRYKAPDSDESSLIEYPITDNGISNECDFDFICGVIETSMDLRDSDYKGTPPMIQLMSLHMSVATMTPAEWSSVIC